jgi:hypothetical protein
MAVSSSCLGISVSLLHLHRLRNKAHRALRDPIAAANPHDAFDVFPQNLRKGNLNSI